MLESYHLSSNPAQPLARSVTMGRLSVLAVPLEELNGIMHMKHSAQFLALPQHSIQVRHCKIGLTKGASWRCAVMGEEEDGPDGTKISTAGVPGAKVQRRDQQGPRGTCQQICSRGTDNHWRSNDKMRLVRCEL